LAIAIVLAWALTIIAQASGADALLHHHALLEDGPPLSAGVLLFLASWQVMVVAMMLPASLPAISQFDSSRAGLDRSTRDIVLFLTAYFALWSLFGLFAFVGDSVVHRLVHASPFLEQHSWLIEAGIAGLAGVYQLSSPKRRSLTACRHPAAAGGGLAAGLAHGLDCLGSSAPLMLLMFAAGFANLWWMIGLTALMVYEVIGRHGHRVATIAGGLLVGLAVYALGMNGLPAWGAA